MTPMDELKNKLKDHHLGQMIYHKSDNGKMEFLSIFDDDCNANDVHIEIGSLTDNKFNLFSFLNDDDNIPFDLSRAETFENVDKVANRILEIMRGG